MTPPSPEQMANKIFLIAMEYDSGSKPMQFNVQPETIKRIATALREYGEACVKEFAEGHRTYTIRDIGEYRQAKAEARRSALEEAAKVADYFHEIKEGVTTPRGIYACHIARGIRALIKKEKK